MYNVILIFFPCSRFLTCQSPPLHPTVRKARVTPAPSASSRGQQPASTDFRRCAAATSSVSPASCAGSRLRAALPSVHRCHPFHTTWIKTPSAGPLTKALFFSSLTLVRLQCNKKAKRSDVVLLYAPRLKALDNSEQESLKRWGSNDQEVRGELN